ncbi:MAG: DnaD domain protein [Oscillospiraceae bacterium]|nr:DnaD domain protein [Oscillospiraceae bacterium]
MGSDRFTVSADELSRLVAAHDGDVALLWLYRLLHGSDGTEEAARALCRTRAEMEAAREKLRRMEKNNAPAPAEKLPPPDETPEYTAKDIAVRSREDPRFASLVTEAQRALGRILSSSDLKKLFGLYDYLALPPEVIMMLLNYCVSTAPAGNPPSMRLIEKEGYVWANREILTLEQAEEYIESSRRRKDQISRAAQILGISGRPLVATETKYLSEWLDMGFGEELLALAYDRTLTNTGSLKWSYMNGILKSWHEKGPHTEAEVRDRDTRKAKGQAGKTDAPRNMDKLLAALEKI